MCLIPVSTSPASLVVVVVVVVITNQVSQFQAEWSRVNYYYLPIMTKHACRQHRNFLLIYLLQPITGYLAATVSLASTSWITSHFSHLKIQYRVQKLWVFSFLLYQHPYQLLLLSFQDICKSLWCHRVGHRCETKFMPAAEGTVCGLSMVNCVLVSFQFWKHDNAQKQTIVQTICTGTSEWNALAAYIF